MKQRTFQVTVEIDDPFEEELHKVPAIIRGRFEETGFHVTNIDTDITVSNEPVKWDRELNRPATVYTPPEHIVQYHGSGHQDSGDEAFATWHYLEFGYRPRGAINEACRSAFESGRSFERQRAIKLLDEVKGTLR